jgi:hypothetical protein
MAPASRPVLASAHRPICPDRIHQRKAICTDLPSTAVSVGTLQLEGLGGDAVTAGPQDLVSVHTGCHGRVVARPLGVRAPARGQRVGRAGARAVRRRPERSAAG